MSYVYIFEPGNLYEQQRTDDKREIERAVLWKLSQEAWCGYGVKVFYQQYVEQKLKVRVRKIVKYIWDRGLCHVSFLEKINEHDLRSIYDKNKRRANGERS